MGADFDFELPLAVAPASVSISSRAAVSGFDDDVIMGITSIYTVVTLGVAPSWGALSSGFCQHLFRLVAVSPAVLSRRVGISRGALIT